LLAESFRHRSQYKQAAAVLQQNVESCQRTAPGEVITALNNVSHALDLSGDTQAAGAAVDRAIALEQRDPRRAFPNEVINSLKIKARLQTKEGQLKEAQATYAQLIAQVKRHYTTKNPHLPDYLLEYSDVLAKNGKQKESAAVHAEAERLYQAHP
jgi:tetratricopeptide (TPR) repeat protein